ncbi:MAG: tRNA (adenine-N1)-methyltransferase [Acidimicrobiia bacterium]|nr:tRNA (adenine-N1)-methyltransferase [Acidimicrobiia bacterium]MDH3471645.1 tRNA (adenine-N1)-methyltransferase [Acidimicrobiia bacterium]
MGKPFHSGETCLLLDAKGRHYLITLSPGLEFQYHAGVLSHDEIIGASEGVALRSSGDARLVALRPRLADYILRMQRGAQVVYPKDIGPILIYADVGPGMTVVEAGTGSGALTMALLRAVGPAGRVISVDRRADHSDHAAKMISGFFEGIPAQLDLRVGEVSDALADVEVDRVVLDVPEPADVVPAAADALTPGGVLCAYLPTVPQVQHIRTALRDGGFSELHTFEVMMRDWVADGRSVRPEHRMVGHTGFITTARLIDTQVGN